MRLAACSWASASPVRVSVETMHERPGSACGAARRAAARRSARRPTPRGSRGRRARAHGALLRRHLAAAGAARAPRHDGGSPAHHARRRAGEARRDAHGVAIGRADERLRHGTAPPTRAPRITRHSPGQSRATRRIQRGAALASVRRRRRARRDTLAPPAPPPPRLPARPRWSSWSFVVLRRRAPGARSCVPRSTIRPCETTTIRVGVPDRSTGGARRRRLVRFAIRRSSASCTSPPDSRVERGRRLVEDQDRRVLRGWRARSRGAGAGRPESRTPEIADRRVVALRQRRDELVRVGGARRGDRRPRAAGSSSP